MGKIVLCVITLMGFAVASKAQGVFQLTKKDGGPSGFYHVKQETDAEGNTKMICSGAGNTKSEFNTPPNTSSDVPDINKAIRFVEEQVRKGKLSGQSEVEGMRAQWQGADVYNYTLTMIPGKTIKKISAH